MRKKLIALAALGFVLTGCSSASGADAARSACVTAAEKEVGASIDASKLEAANMDDALYEAGITNDRKADGGDGLYTVAGKFTYEKDGTESRRSMVCTVKQEDGTFGEPDLAVVGD